MTNLTTEQINALVSKINNSNKCDATCRREKMSETLKQKWINAKNNLKNAPSKVKTAEKNYYVFSEGQLDYDEMLLQRYKKTADIIKRKAKTLHNDFMNNMRTMIDDYRAEVLYSKRMNELLETREKLNKKLKSKLDDKVSNNLTNDRRFLYEDKELNRLQTYRTFLIVIYFAFAAVFLIFGNFFKKNTFNNKIKWIDAAAALAIGFILFKFIYSFSTTFIIVLIIGYVLMSGLLGLKAATDFINIIIIPFIIDLISRLIFYIYYRIKYIMNNKAPKNVYTNL